MQESERVRLVQRAASDGDRDRCLKHRWALALLQPGVEPVLRDRCVARFAMVVVVGLGERARRLLEQPLAL